MPNVEDILNSFPDDSLGFHLKRLLNNLGIATPDEDTTTVEGNLPYFI